MAFLMAYCLAFIIGQFQTKLPSWNAMAVVGALFIAALIIHQRTRNRSIKNIAQAIIGFLLGYGWLTLYAYHEIDRQLPVNLQNQDMFITVFVDSLVVDKGHYQQFSADVFAVHSMGLDTLNAKKVLLNFYRPSDQQVDQKISPCDQLQVWVKLKRPRGLINDAGFDYATHMFQAGIHAKGYIKKIQRIESASGFCLQQMRQEWRDYLLDTLTKEQAAWILALTIGDKSALSQHQRQLLSITGLGHLFVISGLHIGLVAGIIYWLVLICRRFGGGLVFTGDWRGGATFLALIMACIYAMMAGFSYSTQRALVAVSVFMLLSASRLHLTLWFRYLLSMAAVLSISPVAPLSAGFALSFFAVFILLLVVAGTPIKPSLLSKTRLFVGMQVAISIAMFPVVASYFQMVSFVAPVMNLWVIPLMSVLIIPLALLSAVLWLLGFEPDSMLGLLAAVMDYMFVFIEIFLKHWPLLSHRAIALPTFAVFVMLLSAIGLIMPAWLPLRAPSLVVFLATLISAFSPVVDDTPLRLDVLDVGQGSAVIIKTPNHTMLYDTGAGWNTGSMASWVLLPVLRQHNINYLDKVMISHLDNDHSGGLVDLLKGIPVKEVISSELIKGDLPAFSYCQKGQQWQWDGVIFTLIHPSDNTDYDRNNGSCVLLIEYAGKSILLPGDIEKEVERVLLKQDRLKPVDVLLMPHHGSNTSSTEKFIEHLEPKYAIASSGYLNRYRHPHPKVIKRYQKRNIEIFNTAMDGAISIVINDQGELNLGKARDKYSRYWHWH